jgi:multisubunit Na+/H+ antiporter MnhB subunit
MVIVGAVCLGVGFVVGLIVAAIHMPFMINYEYMKKESTERLRMQSRTITIILLALIAVCLLFLCIRPYVPALQGRPQHVRIDHDPFSLDF